MDPLGCIPGRESCRLHPGNRIRGTRSGWFIRDRNPWACNDWIINPFSKRRARCQYKSAGQRQILMSHTHYSGDPRQITARFPSTCHTCGKLIKKGETIIYWPNGKKAGHYDCDIQDYRQSIASFEDEDRYNNVYHWFTGRASFMKVLPFLMFFFFDSPGQRKTAREKRNPMFGETFL